MLYKVCNKCNNRFLKPYSESLNSWATRKYCSKSCANSANMRGKKHGLGNIPWNKGLKLGKHPLNTQTEVRCKNCKCLFMAKAYRIRDGVKYCSRACHYSDNLGLSTENEKARKTKAYRQWRKAVFDRDDYTCQECGTRGGTLHADHIKPFAFFPELRQELTNGQTLCVTCHKATETYGFRAWRSKDVLAYGLEA